MRSETFEWTGPVVGTGGRAEVSGLAYLSGVRDGVFPPPALGPLGSAEIVEIAPGRVQLICSPAEGAPGRREPDPGMAWLLLDAAIGCVARSLVAPGQGWTTRESRASFRRMEPPVGGYWTANAEASEASSNGVLITGELVGAQGAVLAAVATTLSIFDLD